MRSLYTLLMFGVICSDCFTTEFRDLYNKEQECFAQEKIYNRDTNACYKLLTKGPCPKGHWFVLKKPRDYSNDYPVKIEAACIKEKCGDGEYFWSETKSCVKPKEKSVLCSDPANEELRFNLFGEAECLCMREPPRGRLYNEKEKRCHLLYTQGPCRSGEVLGFDSDSPEPICIIDKCFYEARRLKMLRKLSSDSILAPWKNNSCYELGTQGPCPEGLTFKVHARYLLPSCVSLTNTLFNLDRDCFADESGSCQTEITSRGMKYKRGIIGILKASRRRRNSRRMIKPRRNVAIKGHDGGVQLRKKR